MAPSPGGGRSPSTQPPPSVLRWGLLIGGLVIVVDLGAQAMSQRTASPDDLNAIGSADEVINYVLFSILGIIVVRDTGLFYLGAVAGVLASLLDAMVVAAAASMAPPPNGALPFEQYFAENLAIGVLFAGLSGVMYFIIQRWSRRTK
ncbi:MAG: hypothetical protein E6I52_08020 [Chloroflexi bacterium]|nr:MAG: hypothetical protein E6I52_08020 [Chloroflexota bacterium]